MNNPDHRVEFECLDCRPLNGKRPQRERAYETRRLARVHVKATGHRVRIVESTVRVYSIGDVPGLV